MKPYLGGNPPNRDFLTLAILFHLVCILTFYFSVKLAISDAGLVAIDAVERTGGNPYEAIIAAPFKGCNSWEVATELDRLLNECQRFRNKSAHRLNFHTIRNSIDRKVVFSGRRYLCNSTKKADTFCCNTVAADRFDYRRFFQYPGS
jgi:hypothetical protein